MNDLPMEIQRQNGYNDDGWASFLEDIEQQSNEIHVVHWFRKGLRLHDNPALKAALVGAKTFRCIYILDPWFASHTRGITKWRFLLQSLQDIDSKLRRFNSRLFVIRGQPAYLFPQIFEQWKINRLSFEEDPEPFAKERDAAICNLAKRYGVEVIMKTSHTLYDLKELLDSNKGSVPLTYKKFQMYLQRMNLPDHPVAPVSAVNIGSAHSPIGIDHDEKYGLPTLEDLGFHSDRPGIALWQGGETEALARLDRHLERKAWISNFDSPKISAQSLMANPMGVSPYLRFGCLSARLFFWRLTDLYRSIKNKTDCPMSLHGQLLWREFFYLQGTNNANFDHMKGNPVCVQIPWDDNPAALAKWSEGKTGFPWIDAIMTQLRNEGWIHHVARHAVACFLTRGDLWLSWEEGMKVFDEFCLDVDWSINSGNWMWLSCSSFFQKFFHNYCPITFGQKVDPNGDYIRKYLPILAGYPNIYIYKPWTAPLELQIAAKCVIGRDYPKPMVVHEDISHINMARMKQVYSHLVNTGGPLNKYAKKQLNHIIEELGEVDNKTGTRKYNLMMIRSQRNMMSKRAYSSDSSGKEYKYAKTYN